jgi:transposase-like protein
VSQKRPALFRERHFEDVVIMLCARWYLRYSLSWRDLEEIMAERGLSVDYLTIWRWMQRYAPILHQRIRRAQAEEAQLEAHRSSNAKEPSKFQDPDGFQS